MLQHVFFGGRNVRTYFLLVFNCQFYAPACCTQTTIFFYVTTGHSFWWNVIFLLSDIF